MNNAPSEKKASVIIVTGFLGAGKTTLINRILTADHGRRIAVVINELGRIGIDHDLLISSDQEIVQMNNGCICCTVRGDLLRSFFDLLEHRAKFDTIIIETTGLAEPGPVAQSLYADERIRSAFTLDGVVTVVDAKHIANQLEESGEACRQIAFADLILLNKTDLANSDYLDKVEERIGQLNRVASVVRTRNSEMDLAAVFGLANDDLERKIDAAVSSHHCDDHETHDHHNGSQGHSDHHLDHNHLRNITTVCIVEPGALDGTKVSLWFRSLITKLGANILRMKGILHLQGDPDQFVFQGVQTEFEGRPGRAWGANEERTNRLVFIGRDLDQQRITRSFQDCVFTETKDKQSATNAFGMQEDISPLRLDQIRYWMRQNFGFPKEAPIVVKEVPCAKPGCPPVETAIIAIVRHEPPRYFKIQRTINEITFDHVYDLMENPMPCC